MKVLLLILAGSMGFASPRQSQFPLACGTYEIAGPATLLPMSGSRPAYEMILAKDSLSKTFLQIGPDETLAAPAKAFPRQAWWIVKVRIENRKKPYEIQGQWTENPKFMPADSSRLIEPYIKLLAPHDCKSSKGS